MAGGADDIVGHFRLAYQTVVRFPVLIVPPLAVAVLGFMLLFFIGGGAAVMGALMGGAMGGATGRRPAGSSGLVLGMLVFGLVMSVLWLLSAGMVWSWRATRWAGGSRSRARRSPRSSGAWAPSWWRAALVRLIMVVGFLFLVIPGIVAAVFLMFTLPAVLLDRLGALDGIRRSSRSSGRTSGPSSPYGRVRCWCSSAWASPRGSCRFMPFLGGLASFVLHGAAMSYLTVVGVHFYQLLRARRAGTA